MMYLLNGKKISIDAPFEFEGIRYPNMRTPAARALLGVVEVPDPAYPDPELYYWTENEDGSLAITPKAPEQIAEARMSACETAVQALLDKTAADAGYDDIKTAVSYADEPAVAKFQIEGTALRAWRSLVWAKCYSVMAEVVAETRPLPTVSELLAELPAYTAP